MSNPTDPSEPLEPSEPSAPLDPAGPGAGASSEGTPLYGTPPADGGPPAEASSSPYGAPPSGAIPPVAGYSPPPAGYGPPVAGYGPPPGGLPPVYGATPTYQSAELPPLYNNGGGPTAMQNQLGTWALVLGIVGIVLACACALVGLAGAIPAIILGTKGKAAAAQGQATNGSSASAGVVLGWIGVVLVAVRFVSSVATGFGSYDFGS